MNRMLTDERIEWHLAGFTFTKENLGQVAPMVVHVDSDGENLGMLVAPDVVKMWGAMFPFTVCSVVDSVEVASDATVTHIEGVRREGFHVAAIDQQGVVESYLREYRMTDGRVEWLTDGETKHPQFGVIHDYMVLAHKHRLKEAWVPFALAAHTIMERENLTGAVFSENPRTWQ